MQHPIVFLYRKLTIFIEKKIVRSKDQISLNSQTNIRYALTRLIVTLSWAIGVSIDCSKYILRNGSIQEVYRCSVREEINRLWNSIYSSSTVTLFNDFWDKRYLRNFVWEFLITENVQCKLTIYFSSMHLWFEELFGSASILYEEKAFYGFTSRNSHYPGRRPVFRDREPRELMCHAQVPAKFRPSSAKDGVAAWISITLGAICKCKSLEWTLAGSD